MSLVYVHLSDVHFGQEKGGQVVINNDAKARLIDDVRNIIEQLPAKAANGIIISGDIAYAGQKTEYDAAFTWISQIAEASNCPAEEVMVVPGNHDINLNAITPGTQTLINDIAKRGDVALDEYLGSESDSELLYHRFSDYRVFAAAYNCGLDGEGTITGTKKIEIAPNRFLKFHCINTALICSKSKTEEGSLLLGKRQRVIPQEKNVEVIVIGHHPMNWLQDSHDALKYIKNRARVFISGHEHKPSHKVEPLDNNCHLLSLAAGATVPPNSTEEYTYCYNVLEFSWNEANNCLVVKVWPRIWHDDKKAFGPDSTNFNADDCTFELQCPVDGTPKLEKYKVCGDTESANKISHKEEPQVQTVMKSNDDQILLLRFFKDLNSAQRIAALSKMGVFPLNLSDKVTHTLEVLALKKVFATSRGNELKSIIEEILSTK